MISTALNSLFGHVNEFDLGRGAGVGGVFGGRSGGFRISVLFLLGGGLISHTSGIESEFCMWPSIFSISVSLFSSLLFLSLLQQENIPFLSTVGYSIMCVIPFACFSPVILFLLHLGESDFV